MIASYLKVLIRAMKFVSSYINCLLSSDQVYYWGPFSTINHPMHLHSALYPINLHVYMSTSRYILKQLHCGESKTQRKWFLDEKRDGLVDDNRINNQQNEKQQKVYTPKKSFCRSNKFQTINSQLIYTSFSPEYSFQLRKGCFLKN